MAHDPGYIKGYLPGVRENGGQYTHAAIWAVIALARQGLGDEAMELFHMINPVTHARDATGVERYRVEPYVVAADVYAHPMHVGRGGWTWYTGSAGWMYIAAIEALLGLRRGASTFSVSPCIPACGRFTRSRGDGGTAIDHGDQPTTGAAAFDRRCSTACRSTRCDSAAA
jgi:cyclic beta-1,2-glucan synthetase